MQSDISKVQMTSGMEDLKKRLEIIIAPQQDPTDQSQQDRVLSESEQLKQRREKISLASGQLITAALNFAGEIFAAEKGNQVDPASVKSMMDRFSQCVETGPQGRPQLKIILSDSSSLENLASAIAKFI